MNATFGKIGYSDYRVIFGGILTRNHYFFNYLGIFLTPGPLPSCRRQPDIHFDPVKTQNGLPRVEKNAKPIFCNFLNLFKQNPCF